MVFLGGKTGRREPSDNGTELTSNAVLVWQRQRRGVEAFLSGIPAASHFATVIDTLRKIKSIPSSAMTKATARQS